MQKKRTYTATIDGLLEHEDDIVADDALAVEALGPCDERGRGESVLRARKGEGEAERIGLAGAYEMLGLHELGQALGYVVEELDARAGHDRLRYEKDLGLDLDLARVQIDEQDAKVGAAEVEREYVAAFGAVGQRAHIRRKHLDVRVGVRGRIEAVLHLLEHERHDLVQVLLGQLELAEYLLDLVVLVGAAHVKAMLALGQLIAHVEGRAHDGRTRHT